MLKSLKSTNLNFEELLQSNKTNKELLVIAKQMELEWRTNNNPPAYVDVSMFNITPEQSFQYKAVIQILFNFLKGNSAQLLSGTGTGKTYINFSVLDILSYYDYFTQLEQKEGMSYPFKVVYFTPTSVVDQTNEVKKLYNNIKDKCIVVNYETLRTKKGLGNVFLQWVTKSEKGELYLEPEWYNFTAPPIIVCDENQQLKNASSIRTKIVQAYLSLKHARKILVLFSSATPFVRPIESKIVVCGLSPLLEIANNQLNSLSDNFETNAIEFDNKNLITRKRVIESNFSFFMSNSICGSRIKPDEYSPAAMERLTNYLSFDGQLVHVSEVKFKHKAKNKHILIDFFDKEEAEEYEEAYQEYVEELLKHNKDEPGGMAAIFVAILKFREKSELLRARHLARITFEQMQAGKNVISATAFVKTQNAILKYLIEEFKVPADKISIIRGGQSKAARWENINKFQDEVNNISLNMQQAGGVGLSMHHYAPRNKRPRFVLMPPVWSVIEMLQFLGRAHRINSASTTHQWVAWYKGTIEEQVYTRLQSKALSMRELMRKKEQWSDLFVKESEKKNVNLKEVYEKGSTEIINKLESNNEDEDEDEDEPQDIFNLDEEALANNIEEE